MNFGNINLNLYKTFYEVSKYGSFSKTAEMTYTTQSAISKAIMKLEEELETKLFYRKSNGVELTDKGRELLYYVEKSYGNLQTAERMMLETENLERGKLKIGLPSYVASFYFTDKIKEFNHKYPNIEITLMNGSTKYLIDLLEKHQIDFVIDSLPVPTNNQDLTIIKLYYVKYSFVCRKDKYDLYKHIKSVKDLENVPLILPVPGTQYRKDIDEIFVKCGIEPKKKINIHTSEGILNGVKNDMGVGYILRDLVKDNDEYKYIDVEEELPGCQIIMVVDKTALSTVPRKFIDEFMKIEIK